MADAHRRAFNRRRRRVPLELALDDIDLLLSPHPHIERRLGGVGNDVVALAGPHHGEVHRLLLAGLRKAAELRQLIDQFGGGVATVLRGDPGVGGLALHVDGELGRPLAPDGDDVRRIAGLEVQLDVMLARQAADQLGGAGRSGLFRAVDQQGQGSVVGAAKAFQHRQRGNPGDQAALLIADAGSISPAALAPERPRRRRAAREHRIQMGDQQDLRLPPALKRGHQIVGYGRVLAGHDLNRTCAQGLQPGCEQGLHLGRPLLVTGLAIDGDELSQKVEGRRLGGLGGGPQLGVGLGLRRGQSRRDQRRGGDQTGERTGHDGSKSTAQTL